MAADYDLIARIYDPLSRLVFGRTLMRAQEVLLPCIPPGSRILIVGGGTGWVLERISAIYPQGLVIDYVEPSARMMELSRQRSCCENVVRFHQVPIEQFTSEERYGIVITPFLFDNFSQDHARRVFDHISAMQDRASLWLYTDYHITAYSPFWQRILLWIMYLFFRIVTGVESRRMPEMEPLFARGHEPAFSKSFYTGFIVSTAYRSK